MLEPKVTVITASYNKPEVIGEAILSVLNQTHRNLEYIIIENSTIKETKKKVLSFKDKRIRYYDEKFTWQQRKGFYVPAYICNKYYPEAKGDFLIFLADDDILLPNCLSEMLRIFKKNPKAKVCYHDQLILYAFKSKVHIEPLVRGSARIFKYPLLSPRDALDGGQVMFRKKLLNQIEKPYFSEEWKDANLCDKLFLEKLWGKAVFYPTNKILSIHRIVKTSTHRAINPLRYALYFYATKYLPSSIQLALTIARHKRRRLKKAEKKIVEEQYRKLQLRV